MKRRDNFRRISIDILYPVVSREYKQRILISFGRIRNLTDSGLRRISVVAQNELIIVLGYLQLSDPFPASLECYDFLPICLSRLIYREETNT